MNQENVTMLGQVSGGENGKAGLRESMGKRYVYALISARAGGLSVGVNMNPDKTCNFDCEYCEVNRSVPSAEKSLDVDVMAAELQEMLSWVQSGEISRTAQFQKSPRELLQLKHVALSGDGEPTLSPHFLDAVRAVVHVRALGRQPFFKVVVITNTSGLRLPQVREALKLLTLQDEIWAKLEAGTSDYLQLVNRPDCAMDQILENILSIARDRPVVIQSLFPLLNQREPSAGEIDSYAMRLLGLKQAGARISLVQIYSADRPSSHSRCGHLPLKSLAGIAQRVRELTGLRAEVF